MSLIICYTGSRGGVIIGDKRRIGFMGDEKRRELLEEEMYSGSIKTKEFLLKRADELGITLKITDEAEKVRAIGEVLMGEVSFKTPMETKRKRIYATTGSFSIVELLGSSIKKIENGDSSIVVFGNKFTKETANKILKKHWKKKTSLKEVSEIFKRVMGEVASKTPSVSREYDLIIKHPSLDKKQSRELLRTTIIQDVKDLKKWRSELKEQMMNAAKSIQMSTKILENGEVGSVRSVEGNTLEIVLNKGVEALDMEWNIKARPGEVISMEVDDPKKVSVGDLVVVEKENLCIIPSKSALKCDVILCRADKP